MTVTNDQTLFTHFFDLKACFTHRTVLNKNLLGRSKNNLHFNIGYSHLNVNLKSLHQHLNIDIGKKAFLIENT